MQQITWGIIGCGDVTEVKSGPAFNKVPNSALVAVMRRDAEKAADYARRHQVPKWYSDADALINDPEVNAIYIATPPASHEAYALKAIAAGKPVYVEKPMALDHAAAQHMVQHANSRNVKLCVAHYRRPQPYFEKIRLLIEAGKIGRPLFAKLEFHTTRLSATDLDVPKTAWRVDPAISGGGLFHDLAPHQLDLMLHFLGEVESAKGIAINQSGLYAADDMVVGNILFRSGCVFSGSWCFSVPAGFEKDWCEITGTKGTLGFSIFAGKPVELNMNGIVQTFSFLPLQHVQQPMIEQVVRYFLDEAPNPCSGEAGAEVMRLIEIFTGG